MSKFQNTDVMVLGASHSLMLSDVPEPVIEAQTLSDNFYKSTGNFSKDAKKSLERFGMWGGTLNVNQFMPDVTPDMLKPKENDFIEPMFRLLSATVVSIKYNPTRFPEAVLRESMSMLVGQTVNLDHETDVANAIGAVKSVEWQEAYTDEATGVNIPAGINGILKIDGLSNPRIARGIQMDPPSIHSNSVTVEFAWEPSHPFESIDEFYRKLGTYTENGELICRVATKIISYKETSLVWHGADPFAQLIRSGRLNNPIYGGSQSSSLSEDNPTKKLSFFDFKSLSEKELKYNTSYSYNDKGTVCDKPNNQNHNKSNMNEEIKKFLESLFGENLLTLKEGEKVSAELALTQIKNLTTKNQELESALKECQDEVNTLKEKTIELEKNLKLYEKAKESFDEQVKSFREETVASYRKLNGENVDQNILALLENQETTFETLKALRKTYDSQLEDKFPMHCNHCGSKDVSRASSVGEGDDDTQKNAENSKATRDVAQRLAEAMLRGGKQTE